MSAYLYATSNQQQSLITNKNMKDVGKVLLFFFGHSLKNNNYYLGVNMSFHSHYGINASCSLLNFFVQGNYLTGFKNKKK
jgi:hypothetical protein